MFIREASCHLQIELHHPFNYTGLDTRLLPRGLSLHANDHRSISAVIWCVFGFSAPRWQDGEVYCVYLIVVSGSILPERGRDSGMKADLVTVYGFSRKWRSHLGRSLLLPWVRDGPAALQTSTRFRAKHQHWILCLHLAMPEILNMCRTDLSYLQRLSNVLFHHHLCDFVCTSVSLSIIWHNSKNNKVRPGKIFTKWDPLWESLSCSHSLHSLKGYYKSFSAMKTLTC